MNVMANVVTNCSRPNTRPTVTRPLIGLFMKPGAKIDSSTYRKYQVRKNAVIGKTKPRNFLRRFWNSSVSCRAT